MKKYFTLIFILTLILFGVSKMNNVNADLIDIDDLTFVRIYHMNLANPTYADYARNPIYNNYTYENSEVDGNNWYFIDQRNDSYNGLFLQPMINNADNTALIKDGTPIEILLDNESLIYIHAHKIKQTNTPTFDTTSDDVVIIDTLPDKYYLFYSNITNTIPVLTTDQAIVVNVDNPLTIEQIKTHITAWDNEDGDLSDSVIIETENYTANMNTVGTYIISFSVTDTAGNTTNLDVNVLVKDSVAPVIIGTNVYTQSMTTLLDVNIIKNNLSVSDNYDSNLSIVLLSDNYSANYNLVGSYQVKFKSTDTAGYIGNYTVTVNVIDDVQPIIDGPETINKGITETLTTDYIKSLFTATDNKDGVISSNIAISSDNYSGNGDKVGSYNITFSITDTAGNSATKTVNIIVQDNIPPVFYVDGYFITVEESINLTLQDIIDLLTATGQINVQSQATVLFVTNEYLTNENSIGTYSMVVGVSSVDGSYNEIPLEVNVVAADTAGVIVTPDLDDDGNGGFWNGFLSILIWIWNAIVWFIKWIIGLFK